MRGFFGPLGMGKARAICACVAGLVAIVLLVIFLVGVVSDVRSSVQNLPTSSSPVGH
jgi:hypothetical protein